LVAYQDKLQKDIKDVWYAWMILMLDGWPIVRRWFTWVIVGFFTNIIHIVETRNPLMGQGKIAQLQRFMMGGKYLKQ